VLGVAAQPADLEIVREFFELFKTPWEVVRPNRRYRSVLCTDGNGDGLDADVIFAFGADPHPIDLQTDMIPSPVEDAVVRFDEVEIPIYGRASVFAAAPRVRLAAQGRPLEYRRRRGTALVHRVGYDLFKEVRHLLTVGQPPSRALIPTLDRHIELLRRLLTDAGVPFLEIPPRPAGYDFVCCLTHDIDFYGIRRHGLDRTLAGFLLRASIGSVIDCVRSRRTLRDTLRNLAAVSSLPLVYAGLVRDFWRPFDDYASVEDPRRSTFFLVPFKGRPGQSPSGLTDATRAVAYQASDIAGDVSAAAARGSEIGVHGIDAWRDASAGRVEMRAVASITGRQKTGVRMHWLYFSAQTPRLLEEAGFDYDSTWGYNDAVGFRAGTSQVFAFPGAPTLLELPLSIMDTALFAWDRWAMTRTDAWRHCDAVLAHAARAGGTVVINWHCRSLAPERLWRSFYDELLSRLSGDGRVWFATAGDAAEWFRWRRSISFREASRDGTAQIRVSATSPSPMAGAIRVRLPVEGRDGRDDRPFDGSGEVDVELPLGALATSGSHATA
jgi:hypothetical protein